MNLFVLSELYPENRHVGWSAIHSLEEPLSTAVDAVFIYPSPNKNIQFLRRYRHRIFKSWYRIDDLPTLGRGPNILLAISLKPNFLLSMLALGPLLKKFDLRIAYLLDSFAPGDIDRDVAPLLDHLFVMSAEIADEINERRIVSATFLPLATNTLFSKFNFIDRSIDVISYGRTNSSVHKRLQLHFNEQPSNRIYFHSTFSHPEVINRREHVTLLFKLLSISKISLCFEPSSIRRFWGYSPIQLRWFEAWISGCTVVGKRPFGKGVPELMDWKNSAIEIPDNSADWIPFFEELLRDRDTLIANSRRNYYECLRRHDWRYRVRHMFNMLGLPVPEKLQDEIALLRKIDLRSVRI